MTRNLEGRVQQERAGIERLRRQMEAGLPDIPTWRRRIDDLSRIAATSVTSMSKQKRLEVDGVNQRLRGLDPRATLRRGFSVVELVAPGKALTSISQASPGDQLRITVADGEVPAVAGTPGADANARRCRPQGSAGRYRLKRKRNSKSSPNRPRRRCCCRPLPFTGGSYRRLSASEPGALSELLRNPVIPSEAKNLTRNGETLRFAQGDNEKALHLNRSQWT